MKVKVVLSDRSFTVKDEVQDRISDLRWEYNRIGGCGAFSFKIPERFCEELVFGALFNIKIYRWNESTNAYDLWYQGRIEDKVPKVRGNDEFIEIRGMGYQSELKDIYVDRDYSSKTIDFIVEDIIDNDITPNTNITKGTINATAFTADSLSLNTDAKSAFETLADILGGQEWGVDKDRQFTFQPRSSTVGFRFPMGAKITKWSPQSDYKNIVNRVIVFGDGFERTVNDTPSQNKYGIKMRPEINTAITTNAVADQLGNAIMDEFKDIVRRAKLEIVDEQQIEATIPLDLVQVRPSKQILYGEKKYGQFLYQGLINYQINRVSYNLDDFGNLRISLQLGHVRPSISENISQLEFELDQIRQKGV